MNEKNGILQKVSKFSKKIFLEQKLLNTAGIVFVGLVATFLGYLIARQTIVGLSLVGGMVGLFAIFICLAHPETGLYMNVGYSFFAFHLSRFLFNDTFPVGVVSDILVLSTFLGVYIRGNSKLRLPPAPVFTCFLLLYAYDALEFFNPYAHSFAGWYNTFRKVLAEFLLLMIGYNLLTNVRVIRTFITVLFVLCTICGIYGCIQQWHGLFNFELAWAMSDENRFGLMFIGGEFRKMSTMSDPTGYSVIMGGCAVFFIVLATGQRTKRTRWILFSGIVFMLLGMAYSGTRTANAMFVAGLVLFLVLTFNKKSTRIFAAIGGFIFLVIMYGPYSNATIQRFRTTFSGSEDESYKVRVVNKAYIQPYMQAHPIGGGMGVTGGSGLHYNPSHPLAGFPPDSGYMKFALELGWIGLAIILILYFSILRNTVIQYFSARDENLKNLFAACACMFFSFYVAQFAQDSMGQITDIVVYFPIVAISLRGKTLQENGDPINGVAIL